MTFSIEQASEAYWDNSGGGGVAYGGTGQFGGYGSIAGGSAGTGGKGAPSPKSHPDMSVTVGDGTMIIVTTHPTKQPFPDPDRVIVDPHLGIIRIHDHRPHGDHGTSGIHHDWWY